jgi:two-component system, LuxR family, response regulator FixJ
MCRSAPTLFVVDDDEKVCMSVVALAHSLNIPCRVFPSAEEFLDSFDATEPGCLLVDLRLEGMSGLRLLETLAAKQVLLPAILFSAFADVPVTVHAMQHGALTVIEKPYRADALSDAILAAMRTVDETREEQRQLKELRERVDSLGCQQRAVMERIVKGMPNKVIATELDIGMRTVGRLRAAVFQKMECQGAVELTEMLSRLARLEETATGNRGTPVHKHAR